MNYSVYVYSTEGTERLIDVFLLCFIQQSSVEQRKKLYQALDAQIGSIISFILCVICAWKKITKVIL